MRFKSGACAALAAVVLTALTASEASAITCYLVFDRNENITYRDIYPPVDMSDAGRAEREAMRGRGEFMLFLETDQCPRIEYFTGSAGSIGVQLDQAAANSTPSAPQAAAAPAAAPAPAKPAAAAAASRPRKPATPKN